MTGQTALVSGGAGLIGSHLVHELLRQGYHVRAFGRAATTDALPSEVDYWQFDLTGTDWIDQLVGDVDVIFHTAGAASSKADPAEMEEVNHCGTAQLLQAAYEAGVSRVVHVSTSSVYGTKVALPQPVTEDAECRPNPGYAETKWRAEQVAWDFAAKGLEVTVLRPCTVFGPGAVKLLASTILDAAIERHAGLATLAVHPEPVELRLVHVDDVVDACLHLATSPQAPGRAFNLTSGVYPSSHDVAQAVADEVGLELELSDEAEPGLSFERRAAEREAMLAEGMTDDIVLSPERLRFLRKANPNNRLSLEALAETGFRPRVTDLTKAVRESVHWYHSHGWIR